MDLLAFSPLQMNFVLRLHKKAQKRCIARFIALGTKESRGVRSHGLAAVKTSKTVRNNRDQTSRIHLRSSQMALREVTLRRLKISPAAAMSLPRFT